MELVVLWCFTKDVLQMANPPLKWTEQAGAILFPRIFRVPTYYFGNVKNYIS
jgi:hypothetical protein